MDLTSTCTSAEPAFGTVVTSSPTRGIDSKSSMNGAFGAGRSVGPWPSEPPQPDTLSSASTITLAASRTTPPPHIVTDDARGTTYRAARPRFDNPTDPRIE